MFVITFNRDQDPSKWILVGPFNVKTDATEYAKAEYVKNKRTWVIHPIQMLEFASTDERDLVLRQLAGVVSSDWLDNVSGMVIPVI